MTENLPDKNVGNIEYISKQDAIDVAREDGKKIPTVAIRIMHDIKAIPAADVAPVVHGYWFVDERPESDREVICSVCEEPVFRYHDHIDWRPKYCPHCGAKMDEYCPH